MPDHYACLDCGSSLEVDDVYCGSCGTRRSQPVPHDFGQGQATPYVGPPTGLPYGSPNIGHAPPSEAGYGPNPGVVGDHVPDGLLNRDWAGVAGQSAQQPTVPPNTAPGVGFGGTAKADLKTLLGGNGAAALEQVRSGDWTGAAYAVGAGLAAMAAAGLAGLVLLLSGVPSGGLLRALGSAMVLAVGGTVRVSGVGTEIKATGLPLTLTFLGYGLMAFIFFRRLRGAAVVVTRAQALRLLLVQAVAVLILGLVTPGTVSTTTSSGSVHLGVALASTELFSASWLAVVLLLAAFVHRPDWLGPRVALLREHIVGPLAGVVVAFVAAMALTAVALLIVGISVGHLTYGVGAGLLALPNIAIVCLTSGIGAPLRLSGSASIAGFNSGTSINITLTQLASFSSWFWLLPFCAAGCLIMGGAAAALVAPNLAIARRDCLRLTLAVPVALVLGSWLAGVSGSATGSFFFIGVGGAGSVHPSYLLVVLLGAVAGAAAGSLGFLVAPHVPAGVTTGLMRIAIPLGLASRDRATADARVAGTPIRFGAKGQLVLVVGAVVLAFVVSGSVLDRHLANTTYGPQQTVAGYLTDLKRGNEGAALRQLQAAPTSPLLSDDVLRRAMNGAPVHNIHVRTASRTSRSATVSATFDVGSQKGQEESFQLVADPVHQHLGRYPTWRIANPLPVLQIAAGGALSTVVVNGASVALSGGSATLPALPGAYTVTAAGGGPVTADEQTIMITGTDLGAAVELNPHVTGEAVGKIQAAVDAAIADCAKATSLAPPGCPFLNDDYSYGTVTHVVWHVSAPGTATQVQLDDSGAILFSGSGSATVSYVADDGFGSAPTAQSDPVSYNYSGSVAFIADSPQLSFSS